MKGACKDLVSAGLIPGRVENVRSDMVHCGYVTRQLDAEDETYMKQTEFSLKERKQMYM